MRFAGPIIEFSSDTPRTGETIQYDRIALTYGKTLHRNDPLMGGRSLSSPLKGNGDTLRPCPGRTFRDTPCRSGVPDESAGLRQSPGKRNRQRLTAGQNGLSIRGAQPDLRIFPPIPFRMKSRAD